MQPVCEISKLDLLRSRLKSDISLHNLESLNDTAAIAKHVGTIMDQVKHLRSAIENTIELSKIKGHKSGVSYDCKCTFQITIRNSKVVVLL